MNRLIELKNRKIEPTTETTTRRFASGVRPGQAGARLVLLAALVTALAGSLIPATAARAQAVTFTTISAGWGHNCAVTSSGGLKCWGNNFIGMLGNGTNISSNVPVDVSALTSGVAAISGGGNQTCALTSSGGVKCWGQNDNGQLGNGTNTSSNVPVDVTGLTSAVSAVSAGGFHACALTSSGGLKCWGRNDDGQLVPRSRSPAAVARRWTTSRRPARLATAACNTTPPAAPSTSPSSSSSDWSAWCTSASASAVGRKTLLLSG